MKKIIPENQIKSSRYYSYKPLGKLFGEGPRMYEEEFNSILYESDQQKAKDRQQIIDRVSEKTIKKDILYEKIFNLEPLKEITYTVKSNYDNKSLTVLGSDNSSIIVNWKYDIINWRVNESILTFREVDRSTNEQYDRTINISNGKVEGSRRVMLEERVQEFVDKTINEPERGPIGLGSYPGIQGGPYGPVITLIGPNPISLECKGTYTEFGATANDMQEGPLPVTIGGDVVDTNTLGTYLVIYTATTEKYGKTVSTSRTVNVIDTISPVVTLNGLSAVDVECSTSYNEEGATAVDHCDGTLSVTVGGDTVNTHLAGTYVVSYSATDSSGNTGTNSRTVTVRDTIAPVVTLIGSSPTNHECGDNYIEPGATAVDACDGNLPVTIGGDTVDDSTLGTYTVTYSATDTSGNIGAATRTVLVVDTIAPVVTLNGLSAVDVECNTSYTELCATAVDHCDGVLSVTVGGDTVNASVAGTYTVGYSATDSSGNIGTNSRTVVVGICPPVVSFVTASSEKTAAMIGVADPSGDPSVFNTSRVTTGEVNRYLDGPKVDTTTFSRDVNGDAQSVTNTTGSENCEGYLDNNIYNTKRITTFSPNTVTGASGYGTASGGSAVKTTTKSSSCVENSIYTSSPTTVTIDGTESDCGEASLNLVKIYTGSGDLNFNNISETWEGNITGHIREEECDGTFLDEGPFPFNSVGVNPSTVDSFGDPLNQSGSEGTSYANPDTETNALAAATATSGTHSSSLYQLRTDTRNFTHRTATYTVTASNLVVGVEYEGCVRIRRREAYSGTEPADANTDWSYVASDTIAAFTATSTQEEIATNVALPIARGYEYEVVSVHVWAVSSGNSCPTS